MNNMEKAIFTLWDFIAGSTDQKRVRYNRLRPQNKSRSHPTNLSSNCSGGSSSKKGTNNNNGVMTTSVSYTTDANGNRISPTPSTSSSPSGELSPNTTSNSDVPTVWRYDFDNSDSDYEDDDDDGESTPHIASSGDESSDFGKPPFY